MVWPLLVYWDKHLNPMLNELSFGQIFSPYVCMETNLSILKDLPYFEINRSIAIRRKENAWLAKN